MWFGAGLGIGILAAVFLTVALGGRGVRSRRVADGGQFQWNVPGTGESMELFFVDQNSNPTGTGLMRTRTGEWIELSGKRLQSGEWVFVRAPGRRDDLPTNAVVSGKILGDRFVGKLLEIQGGTNANVEARLTAEAFQVRIRRGMAFREWGGTKAYQASFPQFVADDPLHARVNDWGRSTSERLGEAFVAGSVQHVWEGLRLRSHANRYEAQRNIRVVMDTPHLVSLMVTEWEYTGGAHGNYAVSGETFALRNGQVHSLRLADLFRKETPWLDRLARLCVTDLKRQEASGVMGDEPPKFAEPDLSAFTVTRDHLRIHFSPYAVGSWAEGEFEVAVPWVALREVLETDEAYPWIGARGK